MNTASHGRQINTHCSVKIATSYSILGQLKLASLITLLLVFSGCASLQHQKERIKVTIADLSPLKSTLMEQRFLVKIRLQNRSKEALNIDGMSFDLDLNGKNFASGVSSQAATIPGYSESMLEVKISSTVFGLIRQLDALQGRQGEPFEYRISGNLSTPDSLFALPFSESGEINLLPSTTPPSKIK
ncbi:MAG: LEA type 2 family protein [Candidatus Thiodiazotropha sp. (ex Lucinoma kastoroae)]|nr:LEA type 2 family protein [Candidatus Thiodiazotropha sp. (ex Rostrolucina anterorostrata)]MCU7849079.1 LEA type 2 family protein [Candidatus Thiodiazotropha sp. (ex Lucinoma kastoroae)]MCU7861116.1 LEA type 2 family protein [Candidatus Thiodiazotropha sp. (ex Lucinoma kastoroae)]